MLACAARDAHLNTKPPPARKEPALEGIEEKAMSAVGRAVARAWAGFEGAGGLNNHVKVALIVGVVCALSAAQVLSRAPKKEGHDLFSSEKPAAVRGDKARSVEAERAKQEEATRRR